MNAPTFIRLTDIFDDPLFVNLAMVKRFEVRDLYDGVEKRVIKTIHVCWIGNEEDTPTKSSAGDLADQLARLGA